MRTCDWPPTSRRWTTGNLSSFAEVVVAREGFIGDCGVLLKAQLESLESLGGVKRDSAMLGRPNRGLGGSGRVMVGEEWLALFGSTLGFILKILG